MSLLKVCLVAVTVMLMISCGSDNNSSQDFDRAIIISEDSLVALLKDIHIVDAAAKQNVIPGNSNNHVKYGEYKMVLKKHEISKMRFDSTIDLYTRNGKKFDALYERVIKELKEMETVQSNQSK